MVAGGKEEEREKEVEGEGATGGRGERGMDLGVTDCDFYGCWVWITATNLFGYVSSF